MLLALVPIPSVRWSILHSHCMECVPIMPRNAWPDRAADSTSQVWRQLSFLSNPINISSHCPLSSYQHQHQVKEEACELRELLVVSGEQAARLSISPFPPPNFFLCSAVFALLNAHSCQSWCAACCTVDIFLLFLVCVCALISDISSLHIKSEIGFSR